jgi:hypothetical protein
MQVHARLLCCRGKEAQVHTGKEVVWAPQPVLAPWNKESQLHLPGMEALLPPQNLSLYLLTYPECT